MLESASRGVSAWSRRGRFGLPGLEGVSAWSGGLLGGSGVCLVQGVCLVWGVCLVREEGGGVCSGGCAWSGGCLLQGGMVSAPGGGLPGLGGGVCLVPGRYLPGPGGVSQHALRQTPSPSPPVWTEFLTHACENITLAQLRCGR